jgi:hypothetical protein
MRPQAYHQHSRNRLTNYLSPLPPRPAPFCARRNGLDTRRGRLYTRRGRLYIRRGRFCFSGMDFASVRTELYTRRGRPDTRMCPLYTRRDELYGRGYRLKAFGASGCKVVAVRVHSSASPTITSLFVWSLYLLNVISLQLTASDVASGTGGPVASTWMSVSSCSSASVELMSVWTRRRPDRLCHSAGLRGAELAL